MATLVPSPILTSSKSKDKHDPNMIGGQAVKLLNQAQVDTHYDPIPDARPGENFTNFTNFTSPSGLAITVATIGILLILIGIFKK